MNVFEWFDKYSINNPTMSNYPVDRDAIHRAMITTYWEDKYSNLVKYTDMDDKYLRNAYLLARRTSNRAKHIPYLAQELTNRGFRQSEPELFI